MVYARLGVLCLLGVWIAWPSARAWASDLESGTGKSPVPGSFQNELELDLNLT